MTRPDDIPQDVWNSARIAAQGWEGSEAFIEKNARAILAERERCARRLEPIAGYFKPPQGFYEALYAATEDDGNGFRMVVGDTGNWAAFMVEVLKPFAAAIRKGGQP